MIRYLLIFVLVFINTIAYSQLDESLFENLDSELEKSDEYINLKRGKISNILSEIDFYILDKNEEKLYEIYRDAYNEYRSFMYDSAYFFLQKSKQYAYFLNDPKKVNQSKIDEGFILLSGGLFKESIDTLNSVESIYLSNNQKVDYYSTLARAYYDLADYNDEPEFKSNYMRKGNVYLDKAIEIVDKNTNKFWSIESLRRMKKLDWKGAEHAFYYWINNYDLTEEYYGIATSSLAHVYDMKGFDNKAVEYLIKAAIQDVKSATKETVALRNLAFQVYNNGNIDRAYRYIRLAMEEAQFYNARHRKIEIAQILPIIEGAQLIVLEQQSYKLEKLSIILVISLLFLLLFTYILYRQYISRNRSRKDLIESNNKLNILNTELTESNKIKEIYISGFLQNSADFIKRLDELQNSVTNKVISKKTNEILPILKKYSVKKERKKLFENFDKLFLELFPTFIEDVNKLFPENEGLELSKNGLLGNEMRIFALIRLGFNNSNDIAQFMDLSVATIYSYKARIKKRSLFNNDLFEKKIMDIKSI
jgi:hypothetical protein